MQKHDIFVDPKILAKIPEEGYVELPAMIQYRAGADAGKKIEELVKQGIMPSCSWNCEISEEGRPLMLKGLGTYVGSFSTKLCHKDLKTLGHDADVIGIYTDPDFKEEPFEVHIPEGRVDLLFGN